LKPNITSETEFSERPSKTQRKAAMHELQELGKALTTLSRAQLSRMALDEDLRAALMDYQRLPRFEAQRRQLQYIGKLMRGLDAAPIRAALSALRGDSAGEAARLHRLEALRLKLLDDEVATLALIQTDYPHADLAQLSRLASATRKEQAERKPPRNFRALFRALKAIDDAAAAPLEP
jgi:ribosome-associated protein